MDYGYVIKNSENDYDIFVDLETYQSGYNVIPKSVDPYNVYDIEDVKIYCEANPDKVLAVHPLEKKIKTQLALDKQLSSQETELEEINKQLFNEMVNLVFESEVQVMLASEEGTMAAETPAVNITQLLTKRAELMKSIKALRVQIKQN